MAVTQWWFYYTVWHEIRFSIYTRQGKSWQIYISYKNIQKAILWRLLNHGYKYKYSKLVFANSILPSGSAISDLRPSLFFMAVSTSKNQLICDLCWLLCISTNSVMNVLIFVPMLCWLGQHSVEVSSGRKRAVSCKLTSTCVCLCVWERELRSIFCVPFCCQTRHCLNQNLWRGPNKP